jgi:hypothetical protein
MLHLPLKQSPSPVCPSHAISSDRLSAFSQTTYLKPAEQEARRDHSESLPVTYFLAYFFYYWNDPFIPAALAVLVFASRTVSWPDRKAPAKFGHDPH